MILKPWYKVVTPRLDLREGKPLDALEFAAGRNQRFWRLAQAFSAFHPGHTKEKRWVDGALAEEGIEV